MFHPDASLRPLPIRFLAVMVAASLAGLFLALSALACGPDFPNTIVTEPGKYFRTMPEANFAQEIVFLRRDFAADMAAVERERQTTGEPNVWYPPTAAQSATGETYNLHDLTSAADVTDLAVALKSAGLAPDVAAGLVQRYAELRHALSGSGDVAYSWISPAEQAAARVRAAAPYDGADIERTFAAAQARIPVAPPAGLPAEFAEYATGAIAYRRGDFAAARAVWTRLLALPESARRQRTTWAVFMIAKSWLDTDPARALDGFRETRRLAAAGFPDSLALSKASWGWEARAELALAHDARAARLYLTFEDIGSLQTLCERILRDGGARRRAAVGDVLLQRLVTAYLVAVGGRYREPPEPAKSAAWLATVEAAGARDVAGAERLAWMAYRQGDFAATERWLGRADPATPVTQWVRAKLLLRAGKTDAAAALLAAVVRGLAALPEEQRPSFCATEAEMTFPEGQPQGELAVLHLARQQYTDALDLLVRHGWWTDAAYIAERVLTPEELRRWVDRPVPMPVVVRRPGIGRDSQTDPDDDYQWYFVPDVRRPEVAARALRYLLARRLVRLHQFDVAAPYLPPTLQPVLTAFAAAWRTGHDATQPPAARAAALWQAARIARGQGMELMGTEIEPDWHLYGGELAPGSISAERGKASGSAPSADERRRVAQSADAARKRFHYRYVAAELAWQAALLMPDNAPETAQVLCTAGGWLKTRDPEAADRFYKELVRRCDKTDLGQAAAVKHWFP